MFTQQERVVAFKIINAGKYPARIIATQFVSAYGNESFVDSIKKTKQRMDVVNTILSPSINYFPVSGSDKTLLDKNLFNSLVNKTSNYYIGYYINYINLSDNKKYQQLIIMKMSTTDNVDIRTEVNSLKEL